VKINYKIIKLFKLQQFRFSNTINIHIISLNFLMITIGIDYLIMITFHKKNGVASLLMITSRNNIPYKSII